MTRTSYIIIFILLTFVFKGQNWLWTKSPGGTYGDEGMAVDADISGNALMSGHFTSASLAFGTNTITNNGGYDIFVVKYASNGNPLWAKSAGGSANDFCYSVATDNSGSVFICGHFESPTITFGTFTLTNSGSSNVFLAKYNSIGNILWAKSSVGTGVDKCLSVETDVSGNALITGTFKSPVIAFGTFSLTNSGTSNFFISKYDTNGNIIWAKKNGGTGIDASNAIGTDNSSNVFITGSFSSSSIAFGSSTLTSTGDAEVFIAKYDSNGTPLWAKKAVGNGYNDEGNSLDIDVNGNVYVTGDYMSPTITFSTTSLNNAGTFPNVFLSKYDNNGNMLWAKTAGGTGGIIGDIGYSVNSYTGGVYVSGSFYSPYMAFGTTTLTPASGGLDPMFLARYDVNGNFINAISLSSGGDDQNEINTGPNGETYLAGDFQSHPFVVGKDSLNFGTGEFIFLSKFNDQLESVFELYNTSSITLFPNPNNGSFILKIDNEIENGEIILFNSLGQKVHEQKVSQGQNNIISNCLQTGLFNYIILRDKEQISNGKLSVDKN